jgi:hypothetical protein
MRPQSITDPIFQQHFFSRMTRSASGCLEWTGSRNRQDGYGRVQCDRRRQPAHCVAWQIAHGPIPEGLCVLHKCDNPPCCDPDHLFIGTHTDNMHDMAAKGRNAQPRGEQNNNAKLTAADVLEIRRVYVPRSHACGGPALARRFHVTCATISYVVRRAIWQHI